MSQATRSTREIASYIAHLRGRLLDLDAEFDAWHDVWLRASDKVQEKRYQRDRIAGQLSRLIAAHDSGSAPSGPLPSAPGAAPRSCADDLAAESTLATRRGSAR